ncbi:MAG TPA: protein-L-isoaspartate(D-aspartate) O-methyltransferase [Ktedonobacteraceae bacterium]|nr:protein-L-isoaspartate(D-aspartate) O-methyltransferase [Ktedonobacteraceae bacterium]
MFILRHMFANLDEQRQQLIASLRKMGIRDERVLKAIATVPREIFLDEAQRNLAYADRALPINMGQTISQPLMVATMTQALQLSGKERVLEIGTGSGYQTAILSQLAAYVVSVERHEQLALQAVRCLAHLELANVAVYVGDGSSGWPEAAPYDRILVTAAAPEVPDRLVEQLVEWGMLVIPVGSQRQQELLVVHRAPWGKEIRSLGNCVFVPLIGEGGWHE